MNGQNFSRPISFKTLISRLGLVLLSDVKKLLKFTTVIFYLVDCALRRCVSPISTKWGKI